MRVNLINASNNISFLKKKQPIVIQEEVIKMIPDEEADEKEIVPKLRYVYVEQVRVIKGDKGEDGKEKGLDRG